MDDIKTQKRALILGIGGLFVWVALFSAGAMIDSSGFRGALDPSLAARSKTPGAQPTTQASKHVELSAVARNFVPALLCFTPTNAAILCVLSGLIGGCASNLALERAERQKLEAEDSHEPAELGAVLNRRLRFMAENPFISMFRGFVVFLAFMGGTLVIVDDPFQNTTPSSYFRYVGAVSLLAFVMGYDPTRFEDLLKRIPGIGQAGLAPRPGSEAAGTTTSTSVKGIRETTEIVEKVSQTTASPPPGKAQDAINGKQLGDPPTKRESQHRSKHD